MSEGFLPEFRFCSTAETSVHRLIRRKVMRKLTPLTSGLYNVQHGVCQFALAYFRFRIPEYSGSIPFQWTSVKYVGYGLRPPFTSFAIIPRLLYEEKFLLCCPSFFAKWAIENFCFQNVFFRGSQFLLRLSVLHNRQGAKRWDQIQATCSNVRTTTMQQLKYKTCKKIKWLRFWDM